MQWTKDAKNSISNVMNSIDQGTFYQEMLTSKIVKNGIKLRIKER